ncbi:hypothetical protein Ddye_027369 [Dipteronia dyeriana]|uniref:F-box domain-containing protein n=1 Tax=Dipteronia dyeriana TaxID=168575 RepID=A0AAD9TPW0_9ROSI|nr:hypothetical protein Ddye_027369 [Dipteronia dyeriana]
MAVTPRNCKIPTISNVDEDNGDRLSSLPEHIIHHIFSFLDTVDVVRASSVSQKWRYLYVSMPHLNFNIITFWSLLEEQEQRSIETTIKKFKDFVDGVLLSQNCSVDIQNFCLNYLKIGDDNTIYRWMNVMARRNFLLLAVAKPECSASFYNLKSLTLLVSVDESGQSIIQLLNHSPNLEDLTIIFESLDWSECWEIRDEVTCSTYHLKSVRLLDFGGSENELELVRFLLKKGVVLEKLSITWRRGVENRREIIREIKKFPTSSNVAFTFFKPGSNI